MKLSIPDASAMVAFLHDIIATMGTLAPVAPHPHP